MKEVDSDGSSPSKRILLVLFSHEGKPDLFPEYTQCASMEQNTVMNEWFEQHTREARDVIRTLGGAILQQNWFWVGLEANMPVDGLDESIQMIDQAPNVTFTQLQQRTIEEG